VGGPEYCQRPPRPKIAGHVPSERPIHSGRVPARGVIQLLPVDGRDAVRLAQTRALMREYAAMPHALSRWSTAETDIRALPAPFADPGRLLLAVDARGPHGCGALRLLPDVAGAAEIKRVYVREQARGQGIGEQLMRTLMTHALQIGCNRVLLDTAPELHAARALYGRLGFLPIAPYSTTLAPDVICFEWLVRAR
jgi:putative acetyltransferase